MQKCCSLVFCPILLNVNFAPNQEQRTIEEGISHTNGVWALLLFVVAAVVVTVCIVYLRRRRSAELKNSATGNPIIQVPNNKTQYNKTQSEKEAAIEEGIVSVDSLNPEELFAYMSRIIQSELLFLRADCGRQCLMDRFHLSKERVGQAFAQGSSYNSVADYIRDLRLEYSTNLLIMHPELSISDVSKASGFLSLSVYTRTFRKKYGVTPSAYRAQG